MLVVLLTACGAVYEFKDEGGHGGYLQWNDVAQ